MAAPTKAFYFPRSAKLLVLGIAILAFALGVAFFFWLNGRAQPRFQGRPLRFWLDCFDPHYGTIPKDVAREMARISPERAHQQALAAVEVLGQPKYECLVEILAQSSAEPSRFKARLQRLLKRLPLTRDIDFVPVDIRKQQTVSVFQALGTNAYSARPRLRALLEKARPREYVAYSLAAVDPRGCIALLQHQEPAIRRIAADALGAGKSDLENVLIGLRGCLAEKDPYLRLTALSSIQRIHGTPIINLARWGELRFLKTAVSSGADIKAVDESGSALTWAVESGNKPVIEFLLARGAKLEESNALAETALDIAIRTKRGEIISLLREWSARTPPPPFH